MASVVFTLLTRFFIFFYAHDLNAPAGCPRVLPFAARIFYQLGKEVHGKVDG
jgi:hypothetical protein